MNKQVNIKKDKISDENLQMLNKNNVTIEKNLSKDFAVNKKLKENKNLKAFKLPNCPHI